MKLERPTTEQKLQEIVATRLKVGPERVDLDKLITEELGLDSMDFANVVVDIEEAFAPVTLSDDAARNVRTLRELADYIDRGRDGAARGI